MPYVSRKSFDHITPYWIEAGRLYFVTICTSPRHANQLCRPMIAAKIFEAARFYQTRTRWHVELLLLMPDHLHGLIGFPDTESMPAVIRAWKHYLAASLDIVWQRDFFDHRIRDKRGHQEKAAYIIENPVRAGLVERREDWPYVWPRPGRSVPVPPA